MSATKVIAFLRPVKLSEALSKVVGSSTSTRAGVTKGLWSYIKQNNLQDATTKTIIDCDPTLTALLGKPRVHQNELLKLVQPHITKIEEAEAK